MESSSNATASAEAQTGYVMGGFSLDFHTISFHYHNISVHVLARFEKESGLGFPVVAVKEIAISIEIAQHGYGYSKFISYLHA